jgi:hypothetical protein
MSLLSFVIHTTQDLRAKPENIKHLFRIVQGETPIFLATEKQ